MKSFFDSLYGRLALVLVLALGAGFGTMYTVFRAHTNDNRIVNLARTFSVQVQLVEEMMRSHADFDRNPTNGVELSATPQGALVASDEQEEFLGRLKASLDEELGRDAVMRLAIGNAGGVWVRLENVPQGERWLYFSLPVRRRTHAEPWIWGLWASFCVVLVGGMALLWGVNKPLRRLQDAIDQVGRVDSPMVDTVGPREIRRLAEQFNSMVLRLKQYEQDRAEMLAGVAHDLRAPITRLRLQLELEDSARRPAMLGNLDGIDAIVTQFLSFARGADPEPTQSWRLQAFLDECVAPYRAQGVVLEANGAGLDGEIMPTLLRRAVGNLLDNAVEYGAAPIVVALEQTSEGAIIRVSDHGPGIPEDKMDVATQAFTRLDWARSGKGHCGLGLAIVNRIAQLHHGRLALRRAQMGGLVAEVHIRLARQY